MKCMIMLLTLISLCYTGTGGIGTPNFLVFYEIECDEYMDGVSTGQNFIYIGEGVDSATGNYIDFFSRDAGTYPFGIRSTLLSSAVNNPLDGVDYHLLNSWYGWYPYIRLSWVYDKRWSISAAFVDTVMTGDSANAPTPMYGEVCSPYSFKMGCSDSFLYVGSRLTYDEELENSCFKLPQAMTGTLIIKNIEQVREPTQNPVRTVLPVIRKARPDKKQVQLINLVGRKLRILSPGVFISPYMLVLKIQRGP